MTRAALLQHNHFIWSSGTIYVLMAKALVQGNFSLLDDIQHPLYMAMIYLAHFLVDDFVRAGGWVSVLAGSLTPVPIYLLTRRLTRTSTAFLAAALAAVQPYLIRFSTETLSESFFIFILLSGMALLAWASDSMTSSAFGLVGLAGGLAYLTRPEGALIMIVGLLILARIAWQTRGIKVVTAPIIWLALGFFILAGPYIAVLNLHSKAFSISRKTDINLIAGFGELYPKWNGKMADKARRMVWLSRGEQNDRQMVSEDIDAVAMAYKKPLGKMIALYPAQAAWIKIKEIVKLFKMGAMVLTWPYLLALLCVFLPLSTGEDIRRSRRFINIVLAVAIIQCAVLVMFFVHLRFLIPVAAVITPLAGLGISRSLSLARSKSLRVAVIVLTAWIAVVLANSAWIAARPLRPEKVAYKDAAVWLTEHTRPDELIISPEINIGFYAARRTLLPSKNLLKTVEIMRRKNVRYFIVSDKAKAELMPECDRDLPTTGLVSQERFEGRLYGRTYPVTIFYLPPAT